MGKFQGTSYVNPFSAKLTDRAHTAPKASVSEPAAKVARATVKPRKAAASVSDAIGSEQVVPKLLQLALQYKSVVG